MRKMLTGMWFVYNRFGRRNGYGACGRMRDQSIKRSYDIHENGESNRKMATYPCTRIQ